MELQNNQNIINTQQQQHIFYLSESTKNQISESKLREKCIMFEYKMMLLYQIQNGIILMPQLDDINIWHAVIFIRQGIFKEGKFKFKVLFPKEFPKVRPEIIFTGDIFHPMIDQNSKKLDMNKLIPTWNYGKGQLLYTVFTQLKNIFIDVKYYNIKDSYNPEAAQLFSQNMVQFIEKAKQSSEQSLKELYTNEEQSPLKFKEYTAIGEQVRYKITDICKNNKEKSMEEKKQMLLSFLLSPEQQDQFQNNQQQIQQQEEQQIISNLN